MLSTKSALLLIGLCFLRQAEGNTAQLIRQLGGSDIQGKDDGTLSLISI